jgi:hypothetical protein
MNASFLFYETHQSIRENMKDSSFSDDSNLIKLSAMKLSAEFVTVQTENSTKIVRDENIYLPIISTKIENIKFAIDDDDVWCDIPTDEAFVFSSGEIGRVAQGHTLPSPVRKPRGPSFGSSEGESTPTVQSSVVHDKVLDKNAVFEKNFCVESRAAYTAVMDLARTSTNGSAERLLNRRVEPAPVRFVRAKCSQLHFNRRWTAVCTLATLSNCAIIALEPELNRQRFNRGPSDAEGATVFTALDSLFFAVMFLEVFVGCAALGFARGDSSWVRSSRFHQIDLAVLLLSVMDYVLESRYDDYRGPFRVFRLFRLLKPVMAFELFRQLSQILRALSRGLRQLATVFAVLALLFLAFAMFGAPLYAYTQTRTRVGAHKWSVRQTAVHDDA